MVKHWELFNPIKAIELMPESLFYKYIYIVEDQKKNGLPTDKTIVKRIVNDFRREHGNTLPPCMINAHIDFIRPKIEKNAGLAQFILDYEATKSDFFFPWLKTVFTSPSEALEMSYGFGKNLRGDYRYANYDSRMYYFVQNDPTFVYNRERQLCVADCARRIIDARSSTAKVQIVDLGAGRMSWLRHHGLRVNPAYVNILAYDHDESIDPETLFRGSTNGSSVRYVKKDIMAALRSGECADTSLFILQGVASYYPLEMFRDMILRPVYKQLRVGGAFFFDLQLDCPYYQRSMKIFDWPEMKLYESPTLAFDTVEKMLGELKKEGVYFSAEYAIDPYKGVPSSIMITLSKC